VEKKEKRGGEGREGNRTKREERGGAERDRGSSFTDLRYAPVWGCCSRRQRSRDGSKAFNGVCLSVCLHDNSRMNEPNGPKLFKLDTRSDLGMSYKWYDVGVERSKVKVLKTY